MDKSKLITIRDGQPGDVNFIYATWLKGLRFGNDLFREIPAKVYFEAYHKVVEALLNRPGVVIRVACLLEDPDVILGYSVSKGDRLDYVFVKTAWRKIGIAKNLVPPTIRVATHLTKEGLSILRKRPDMHFNPFDLT